MRDYFASRHKQLREKRKPARRKSALNGILLVLVGAFMVSTLSPSTAVSAADNNPYIWLSRVDGKVVVQGRYFPKNATGIVKAGVGNSTYKQLNLNIDSWGYFWLTFDSLNIKNGGQVWGRAWVNKSIHKTTSKTFTSESGTSNPSTTTTTARPNTTTTTTAKPTTTTAKPKPTTTTAKPKPTTTTTVKPPSNSPSTGGNGRQLVMQEDFNGSTTVSDDYGLYEGTGNAGIGWRKRSQVTIGGGTIKITGNGDVAGGLAFNGAQTYGRFEVRARLNTSAPKNVMAGYNTAILLWPKSSRWPIDGEIDISEIFTGGYGESCSFVHWASDNKQKGKCKDIDTAQWHTYATEWTSSKISFYIDGVLYYEVTEAAAIPHNPHFLAFQLDVAKANSRTNGTNLEVDWARIYK